MRDDQCQTPTIFEFWAPIAKVSPSAAWGHAAYKISQHLVEFVDPLR